MGNRGHSRLTEVPAAACLPTPSCIPHAHRPSAMACPAGRGLGRARRRVHPQRDAQWQGAPSGLLVPGKSWMGGVSPTVLPVADHSHPSPPPSCRSLW